MINSTNQGYIQHKLTYHKNSKSNRNSPQMVKINHQSSTAFPRIQTVLNVSSLIKLPHDDLLISKYHQIFFYLTKYFLRCLIFINFLQTTLNSNLKPTEDLFYYRQKKFVKEDKCRVIHKSMLNLITSKNLFFIIYKRQTFFGGLTQIIIQMKRKWERNME
ncbi:hypothetical protein ACKWTF_006623 [Chironomus riparius]